MSRAGWNSTQRCTLCLPVRSTQQRLILHHNNSQLAIRRRLRRTQDQQRRLAATRQLPAIIVTIIAGRGRYQRQCIQHCVVAARSDHWTRAEMAVTLQERPVVVEVSDEKHHLAVL